MSATTPAKGGVPMLITAQATTVKRPLEYHQWQIAQLCESVRQEAARTKLPAAWAASWQQSWLLSAIPWSSEQHTAS